MSENKNIDRLFQESFKDFEVEAPKGAWKNIEKKLGQSKNKPVFPIWQKISAAAALVAIMILAGSQWFIPSDSSNSVVESPDAEVIDGFNEIEGPANDLFVNPNAQPIDVDSAVSSDENGSSPVPENNFSFGDGESLSNEIDVASNSNVADEKSELNSKYVGVSNNFRTKTSSTIAEADSEDYSESTTFFLSKPSIQTKTLSLRANSIDERKSKFIKPKLKSLMEVAAEMEDDKLVSKTKKENSWFVKPQIAPVFYGNLGSGSAVDQNFDQNSGQGEVNMTYGLNIAYKLNDKMKIRTGINRVNLNYNTDDLYLLTSSGFSTFDNVSVNADFQSSLISSDQLSALQNSDFSGRIPTKESQLQQQLGFIEIPMELEYKLIDKAIDINIIGGASTLLLNDNSLDIQSGSNTTFLGEANNVNNLSFSTNFAIGLDYDISERLILNFEPTFKYQFNTFQSGTTDFQPFFIGIYSGVVFKF